MDRREVPLGGRDAASQNLHGAERPFPPRDVAPWRRARLRPGRLKSSEWRQVMPPGLLTANESATVQTDARAGKYLAFHLANEEFGIRVLKVKEIRGLQESTAAKQTPAHSRESSTCGGKWCR